MLDHLVHAVLAPRRNPFHLVNLFESFRAKSLLRSICRLIHFDEPLLGRAKDDRIVATPAMRIAVLVMLMAEKRVAFAEKSYDDGVRAENVFAFVFGQSFRVDP